MVDTMSAWACTMLVVAGAVVAWADGYVLAATSLTLAACARAWAHTEVR
jgi:hypothetical protein